MISPRRELFLLFVILLAIVPGPMFLPPESQDPVVFRPTLAWFIPYSPWLLRYAVGIWHDLTAGATWWLGILVIIAVLRLSDHLQWNWKVGVRVASPLIALSLSFKLFAAEFSGSKVGYYFLLAHSSLALIFTGLLWAWFKGRAVSSAQCTTLSSGEAPPLPAFSRHPSDISIFHTRFFWIGAAVFIIGLACLPAPHRLLFLPWAPWGIYYFFTDQEPNNYFMAVFGISYWGLLLALIDWFLTRLRSHRSAVLHGTGWAILAFMMLNVAACEASAAKHFQIY